MCWAILVACKTAEPHTQRIKKKLTYNKKHIISPTNSFSWYPRNTTGRPNAWRDVRCKGWWRTQNRSLHHSRASLCRRLSRVRKWQSLSKVRQAVKQCDLPFTSPHSCLWSNLLVLNCANPYVHCTQLSVLFFFMHTGYGQPPFTIASFPTIDFNSSYMLLPPSLPPLPVLLFLVCFPFP